MSGMTRFRLGATLALLTAAAANAQQASGRITGVITDATGASIPDVTVTATHAQTGEIRRVSSNSGGVYVLYPLAVGDYTLEAKKEGFKAAVQSGIRIDVNSSPTI